MGSPSFPFKVQVRNYDRIPSMGIRIEEGDEDGEGEGVEGWI